MFLPRKVTFDPKKGEIMVTFSSGPKELEIVLKFSLLEANERGQCPVVSIGGEILPSHPKDHHHQICSGCNQRLQTQHGRAADTIVRLVGGIRSGKTTILPAEAHIALVERVKEILSKGMDAVEILGSENYSDYLIAAAIAVADRERNMVAFKEAALGFFHLAGSRFHEAESKLSQLGIRLSKGDMHSCWMTIQNDLLSIAKKVIAEKIENLTVDDLRPNDEEIVAAAVGGWASFLKVIFRQEARGKIAALRQQAEDEKRRQKEARRLARVEAVASRGKMEIRFSNGGTAELPILLNEEEISLFPDGEMAVLRPDVSDASTKVIRVRKKPGGKCYFLEVAGATLAVNKAAERTTETKETVGPESVWVVFGGRVMKVLVIPDPEKVDQTSLFGQHFVRVSPNGQPVDLLQGGIGGFSLVGSCRKAKPAEKRTAKNGESVPA